MKKTLIVILSIILPLALIGIGAGVYFGFFTATAQAKRIASTTMQAAASAQKEAFTAHGTPNGSDSFFTLASQRNYREEAFTQDGDTFYALYAFTDTGTPKKARIGVQGNSVTNLATGDKLGTIPKDDPKQTAQTENPNSHCLTKNDLAYLDSTSLYAKTFRGATMIFNDDTSTIYSGEESGKKLLDRMANFYQKTDSKDYSFMIRGYLAAKKDTLEERKQIIQNRATKIQQELITREVPQDRISIGEPVAYPVDRPTDGQDERYVIIDVVNNCIK